MFVFADLKLAGLEATDPEHLKIRRVRRGNGFAYLQTNGRYVRKRKTIKRLERLAVPPAYRGALFSINPRAHLQAVARDAAGRLQYRYHPDWESVRELRKARRLAKLIDLMPAITRSIAKHLKQKKPNRNFAAAALIDLIACTAIRPGSEAYARERGTRGAATLLKKHVQVTGDKVFLRFQGKGGKQINKTCESRRLAEAIRRLQRLSGRRLFQYVMNDDTIVCLRRRDANAFLCEIAGGQISLKDFRTLSACSRALEYLAKLDPKRSERGKRAQIKSALREVANDLANTPAVCKRSYVHAVVINAFETGQLKELAPRGRSKRNVGGHRLLQKILQSAFALRAQRSLKR
jgi:DNA topoisomerase-1